MEYSQKYCLVAFLEPVEPGARFSMTEWPLHITIADVFSVSLTADLDSDLIDLVQKQPWLELVAGQAGNLGEARVVFVNKTDDFQNFHTKIVGLLDQAGAKFNNPEFTLVGFLPHITINESVQPGQLGKIEVRSVSLIDMFPEGDWRQRKVLRSFDLKGR